MISDLYIKVSGRNGVSFLEKSYFTPPFKVANITEDKRSPWLQLMLMNSSPGILDNDDYTVRIDIGENACLHLHTQSYQRLFDMKTGARQLQEIRMGKDAALIYISHPSVPHENSSFINRNKIFLSDNCRLIWGDVLTCGRKLNGEIFRFSRYQSTTEIYLNNKLIVRENLLLQPLLTSPSALGQLEGYTHQASLLCLGHSIVKDGFLDEVYDYLSSQSGIVAGVSALPTEGLVVRILGNGAEELFEHLKSITTLLRDYPTEVSVRPEYAR
jgi:urease accessory protein